MPDKVDKDAFVQLRIPAGTKARWVRTSRAAGMRLTDWIVVAVEARMQEKRIAQAVIPADLEFSALKLARASDGSVSFDTSVIERICAASGIDPALILQGPETNIAGLIVSWYAAHRAGGGATDPVAEDLITEARIEDERGGGLSHQPGQA